MAKRFFVMDKGSVGPFSGAKIIVDAHTGVQYLFMHDGYAGGLTVLVDGEGKPLLARPGFPNYKE